MLRMRLLDDVCQADDLRGHDSVIDLYLIWIGGKTLYFHYIDPYTLVSQASR